MAQAHADFQSNNINAQGGVHFNTTSNTTHIHSPPLAASYSRVDPRLLMKACRDGNAHLAKELLSHMNPGDVNYADRTDDNNTPLHLVAKADHIELVTLLLEARLIDVNARNTYGDTPLHVAARLGHTRIVAHLLLSPGISINSLSDYGAAPLHVAMPVAGTPQPPTVVVMLLEQTNIDVNIRDSKFGNTPLMSATRMGLTGIVHRLLAHPNIDPNAIDKSGATALHPHVQHYWLTPETIWAVLEHKKTNPNIQDHKGDTPLLRCISLWVREDVIRTLIAHPSVNLNVRNNRGETALSIALKQGRTEISQMMLAHGADPVSSSDTGCLIA